jgi:hypothetical protein
MAKQPKQQRERKPSRARKPKVADVALAEIEQAPAAEDYNRLAEALGLKGRLPFLASAPDAAAHNTLAKLIDPGMPMVEGRPTAHDYNLLIRVVTGD